MNEQERKERRREANRRYHERNRERILEAKRARYQANREQRREQARIAYGQNREVEQARNRARYAANREREQARSRAYYAANKQRVLDTNQVWREGHPGFRQAWSAANPDRERAKVQRRRARRIAAAVEYFVDGEVFQRDSWLCGICDRPIDMALVFPHPMSASIDHIVSLAAGGDHSLANVQAAHLVCNQRKGAS